jgi:hypothetical protein
MKPTTNIAVAALAITCVMSCSPAPEPAKQAEQPVSPRETQPWKLASSVAFDMRTYAEEGSKMPKPSRKLSLELHWMDGETPDTVLALVTITNHGSESVLVFPIDPVKYMLVKKDERTVIATPLWDPPMPNESEMVNLYPRNVMAGAMVFPRKAVKEAGPVRVSVFGTYRTQGGEGERINLESEWTTLPER